MKKNFLIILTLLSGMYLHAVEKSFIYSKKMPKGSPNPCTVNLNYFIDCAVKGQLKKTMVRKTYLDSDKFPLWAVWGYCCPDSNTYMNGKMITMLTKWIDNFLAEYNKDSRKKFSPGNLAMVVYELKLHPEIKEKLDSVKLNKLDVIIKEKLKTKVQEISSKLPKYLSMVNIPLHSFKELFFCKLLYNDEVAGQCIESVLKQMDKMQMPNGMFPYRFKVDGPKHLEFETMYYRAIELRALYCYWYITGSKLAQKLLENGAPYYPLTMELPYFYNGSADPWWKVQYRTFWPGEVAMSAVVSKNSEVAWIANEMGRHNVSRDRFALVAGSLAYRQLAEINFNNMKPKDHFVIADPDICGVRLRNEHWSSTFNTMSYTTTRVAAMNSYGKNFNAMMMARPFIRINPLEKKRRYAEAYCVSGPDSGYGDFSINGNSAVVFSKYRPMLTSTTWKKKKLFAPCEIQELWIMTPNGMAGIINSTLLEDMKGYEFMYQYRFIIHDKTGLAALEKNLWKCGNMSFKIWNTDFTNHVIERDRVFPLNVNDYAAWQIALTNEKRPPREMVLKKTAKTEMILKEKTFPKGLSHFAIVTITPDTCSFNNVEQIKHSKLIILKVTDVNKQFLAIANPSSQTVEYNKRKIKSGAVFIMNINK